MKKSLFCALALVGVSMFSVPVVSVQNTIAATTYVEPRTDIKEWRFKVIDGHLYKRLYNRSTGRWETDWILVE